MVPARRMAEPAELKGVCARNDILLNFANSESSYMYSLPATQVLTLRAQTLLLMVLTRSHEIAACSNMWTYVGAARIRWLQHKQPCTVEQDLHNMQTRIDFYNLYDLVPEIVNFAPTCGNRILKSTNEAFSASAYMRLQVFVSDQRQSEAARPWLALQCLLLFADLRGYLPRVLR